MTGEPYGVRSIDLVESAVARPQHVLAYESNADTLDMGLALLFGLAGNHPFVQGNKRTAFRAMVIFLARNGYSLETPDGDDLANLILEVLAGTRSMAAFRAVLERHVVLL